MKTIFGAGLLAAALTMPVTAMAGPVPSIDWNGPPTTLVQEVDLLNGDIAGCPAACLDGAFMGTQAVAPAAENDSATPAAGAAAIPEPGTWGMLLAGGVVLGLIQRRRANEKFT